MRLVDDLACDVPLRDVGGLVRQYAREFVLAARRDDQPAVGGDEAAGQREGVDRRVADDEVGEAVLAFLGTARQPVTDVLHVFADFRVVEDHAGFADLAHHHEAGAVFVLQRDGCVRRAAELRQVVLGSFGAGHPGERQRAAGHGGGQHGA